VIPLAWVAVELRRNCVVALPDANMAANKFEVDIWPVFDASEELRRLRPTKGAGSRGGKVKDTVTLENGVVIKIMTPFGDDANRAGFTAPIVVVTEAARFSDPSETSVEADPLRQLRARQRALSRFGQDGELSTERKFIVEGTVTTEDELPWKIKQQSTDSRILSPCPHCRDWVGPERENLSFYIDAKTELEAARSAFWACPSCGEEITELERADMVRASKLIHSGQTVTKKGKVRGKQPDTLRLFFRWSAFQNLFTTAADVAVEEWSAIQFEPGSAERELAEKDLCQSIWAVPYTAPQFDSVPLDRRSVSRKQDSFPLGVLPPDTEFFTVGADVGRRKIHYVGMAFRSSGGLHVPFYGSIDTPVAEWAAADITKHHEENAIRIALRELREILLHGFGQEGSSELVSPSRVLIDARYLPDPVHDFVRESGRRFLPSYGYGKSTQQGTGYRRPRAITTTITRIGVGWHMDYDQARGSFYIDLDADQSKLDIQNALRVGAGQIGSLTLPRAAPDDHRRYARHLASEVRRTYSDPGRGMVTEWTKSGENHYLDSTGYAIVAGRFEGWSMMKAVEPEESVSESKEESKKVPEWMRRALKRGESQ
jgi:phage terminase large subunit GpA-like protein